MPEYGLTSKGPNIKRLDIILNEMHDSLSEKWGVNTRQNPQSFLNDLLTSVADRVAELWEYGEQVYYSQYPATAEGINLDNAAQYGGTTRESAAKSFYPIHCTGVDGTTLVAGTLIASDTNPVTQLTLSETRSISRQSFNKAVVKIVGETTSNTYSIGINGMIYSFRSGVRDEQTILNGLAEAITDTSFDKAVDAEALTLTISAADITSTNTMTLSENLTTETVTSIITFGTVETGDILLPEGSITSIVKADAGLQSVVNLCPYIAGHDEESDTSLRQSYAAKIFNRSTNMLESIRSAILNNVQGVESVAPYENPSHEYDSYGRPPHSIEIVVDGGDSQEIAQQILKNKAGGINTYGDVSVVLPGEYGEDITIRFNRPQTMYCWFRLGLTISSAADLPLNYEDLLRAVVLEYVDGLESGEDVVPQTFVSKLHQACSGISYVDITLYGTTNSTDTPATYPDRNLNLTMRQRAFTSESMIEVEIDG